MIVLNDADILARGDAASLLAPLRQAFLNPGHVPPRMHERFPDDESSTLLLMPAWAGSDWIGVKVATVIPGNADRGLPTIDGSYLLMDAKTGVVRAILSAPALTAVRTAGVSALAASLLAREDAKTLLMIGTGALAPHLVRAHCAVRPIDRVILWGRDIGKARALAGRLTGLSAAVEVVEQLSEVLGQADIVSCATLARQPLIAGDLITPGTHVDLVGSFAPDMQEADPALFRRGRLAVDTGVAFDESGDLIAAIAAGAATARAPDLTTLLQSAGNEDRSGREITIFKSVGTAIADLATARHILGAIIHEPSPPVETKVLLDFG